MEVKTQKFVLLSRPACYQLQASIAAFQRPHGFPWQRQLYRNGGHTGPRNILSNNTRRDIRNYNYFATSRFYNGTYVTVFIHKMAVLWDWEEQLNSGCSSPICMTVRVPQHAISTPPSGKSSRLGGCDVIPVCGHLRPARRRWVSASGFNRGSYG